MLWIPCSAGEVGAIEAVVAMLAEGGGGGAALARAAHATTAGQAAQLGTSAVYYLIEDNTRNQEVARQVCGCVARSVAE